MSETSTLIGYQGRTISRQELALIQTPAATSTHVPVNPLAGSNYFGSGTRGAACGGSYGGSLSASGNRTNNGAHGRRAAGNLCGALCSLSASQR